MSGPSSPDRDRRFRSITASRMSLRRDVPGGVAELTFYPIVFESPSEDLGGWREIIGRAAVESAVAGADIRALFDHNSSQLLGRTSSGTLSLTLDDTGVLWRCNLPDTTIGRDVATLWERRDIQGGSFLFTGGTWAREGSFEGVPLYRLTRIDAIWEAGPVTYPAYQATELSRSARELAPQGQPSGEARPACFGQARALGDLDLKSFLTRLENALAAYLEQAPWGLDYWAFYTVAVYDDFVIVFDWRNGRYLRLPYTVAGVEVSVGQAVEVVANWVPVTSGAAEERKRRALRRLQHDGFGVTVAAK